MSVGAAPALFELRTGDSPLIVNIPHAGVALPSWLKSRMTPVALGLPDTDWHVDVLYDFAHRSLGATTLAANFSRYVVDLNRDSEGQLLYAGENETEIVPTTTFDLAPIYVDASPGPKEVQDRLDQFWKPYHQTLAAQIERVLADHGTVVLWDAHSIPSNVPRFFEGELPELNFGTVQGTSCDRTLEESLLAIADQAPYSVVCNERFQGGYITRHYGNPGRGIHAVQLELAQRSYMVEAPPNALHEARTKQLRATLYELLDACLKFAGTARSLRDR